VPKVAVRQDCPNLCVRSGHVSIKNRGPLLTGANEIRLHIKDLSTIINLMESDYGRLGRSEFELLIQSSYQKRLLACSLIFRWNREFSEWI
jgi:hypothetical protein